MKVFLLFFLFFTPNISQAQPTLVLRTHFDKAFNIPPGLFVSNETPKLNNHGNIAVLTNKRILWQCSPTCSPLFTAPTGEFMRLYEFNENPIFELLSEDFYTKGLFTTSNNQLTEILSPEFDFLTVQFFGQNKLLDNNSIIFLAKDGGHNQYILKYSRDGNLTTILKESNKDQIAFIYNPRINKYGQLAAKVIRGNKGEFHDDSPQEIRLYQADGSYQIIAHTKDGFEYLDYGISLNNLGEMTFIATKNNETGLYFWNGQKIKKLFTANKFGRFDAFAPQLNDQKQIVFRGFNKSNRPALFYWHQNTLITLLTEGDTVQTDLGEAQYGHHDPSYPLFSGNIDLNHQGMVAYSAGLHPKNNNQIEWGTGLFKLKLPAQND